MFDYVCFGPLFHTVPGFFMLQYLLDAVSFAGVVVRVGLLAIAVLKTQAHACVSAVLLLPSSMMCARSSAILHGVA